MESLLDDLEKDDDIFADILCDELIGPIIRRMLGLNREERSFLHRRSLLDPRCEVTSWIQIYNERDADVHSFMKFTRFTPGLFNYVHDSFKVLWETRPIEDSFNAPRPWDLKRRLLNSQGSLGLVLHYLASRSEEGDIGIIFGLSASSVSKYLLFSLHCLLDSLTHIKESRIEFPNQDMRMYYRNIVANKFLDLTTIFGFLDGKRFDIQEPSDLSTNQRYYNGWLHRTTVVSIILFSPHGEILFAFSNAPGHWHDAHVFSDSKLKIVLEQVFLQEGSQVLTDSGFPQSLGTLRKSKKNEVRQYTAEMEKIISQARTSSEWGNQMLTSSWRRFQAPLPTSPSFRALLFDTCFALHNLRVRCLGYNEIRKYFAFKLPNEDWIE